jgi:hypothetical protein
MRETLEALGATSWCEGIIGDGCGGGRFFFTCKDSINAYDPFSKSVMLLIDGLDEPQNITKKGCQLFFTCKEKKKIFDFSLMSLVETII